MKLSRIRCAPFAGMITSACKGMVRKPDGRNLLRICMRRRDDSINLGLK